MAVTPTSLPTTVTAGSTGALANTNTVHNAVNQLTTAVYGTALNLRAQPGVVGNGVADDAAAINTALTSAAASGVALYAAGTFKIGSTVTISGDVDLSMATFNYTGTGVAVQVGGASVSFRKVIALPRVVYTPKTGTGWTASTVGVKALNLNACIVTVPHIKGFETGLLVRGEGQGNAYNTFHLGHLENNKRNLVLNADSTGWSNQNTYVGGRYGHDSAEGTDVAGARHILCEVASNPVNGNAWLNPSVEGTTAEQQIDVDGGSYNQFLNPRLERSGGGRVRWGATASQNEIIGGYNVSAVVLTRVSGEQRNNIRGANLYENYGSSTVGVSRVQNTSSNANAAMAIYDAGSVADADWRWQMAGNEIRAKRTAESFNRVVLDGNNSQLLMSTGAAAPTAGIKAVGNTSIQLLGTGLGFYGTTPASRPTVTGSRGGNAALASLLTALDTLGLITDSSTA